MTATLTTARFSSSILVILPALFRYIACTRAIITGIEMFVEICLLMAAHASGRTFPRYHGKV
jgi:hypothetical protein